MDELEDLANRFILSADSILERVDEYTLYCKYLEFEPLLKTKYRSMIRMRDRDSDPSFSLFESRKGDREYFWKDSGTGESGDIFKLIKLRYGLPSIKEVYRKIDCDFKLGFTDGVAPPEKIILNTLTDKKPETRIRIQSKPFTNADLKFWGAFGITLPTLELYRVKSVKFYWMHDFQEAPQMPRDLAYAYEVLGKYKIYQPYMPLFKFRNDFHEKCLEGFAQLTYKTDTLIITKSTKDVMLLRELGYDAVSPRSENTPVPEPFLHHFHKKYKKIFILFDNDMKHRGDMYQEPKIYVPISSGEKDISDYRKTFGHELTKELLLTIVK